MFLKRLIEKYQTTAGELRKLEVKWKGSGKPGSKQKSKKSDKNVIDLKAWEKKYGAAIREAKKELDVSSSEPVSEPVGESLDSRVSRIRSSLQKIKRLMSELDKLQED